MTIFVTDMDYVSSFPLDGIDEETRAALAELGLVYLSELPLILKDLQGQIAGSIADPALVARARNIVHKMRGTAGSLGFPELSELARQLEEKLSQMAVDIASGLVLRPEQLLDIDEEIEKLARLARFLLTGESLDGGAIKLIFFGEAKELVLPLEEIFSGTRSGPVLRAVRMQAASDESELLSVMPGFCADLFLVDARHGFDQLSALMSVLKALQMNPPVLVLIADSSAATRQTLFALGANDFVFAPFCKDEVLARIAAVIKN
jgi:HPt (histidine-containing phosphotransfer) domain-containing protein